MKVSMVEITADESGVWVKINNEYLQGVKSVEFKKKLYRICRTYIVRRCYPW